MYGFGIKKSVNRRKSGFTKTISGFTGVGLHTVHRGYRLYRRLTLSSILAMPECHKREIANFVKVRSSSPTCSLHNLLPQDNFSR